MSRICSNNGWGGISPDRKEKVLNRIKAMRDGKLYKAEWGKRMVGEGIFAEQIHAMFEVAVRKAGFTEDRHELSIAAAFIQGRQTRAL